MKQPVIGIIGGKGNMGKYFASFFEGQGYKVLISDRKTVLSNKALAQKADVVIVSVPIDKTVAVIEDIAPLMKKNQCLMDLTSIKGPAMKAMQKSKATVVGLHPMFGPTNGIAGQTLVICAKPSQWKKWIKGLLLDSGAEVHEMSAARHDSLVAYVQVLSHFKNICFAKTLSKSKFKIADFLEVQSPIYRLGLDIAGRILDQDPHLYSHIQIENPESKKVLKDFLETVQDLSETVSSNDFKAFEKTFKESSKYLGDYTKKATIESTQFIDFINTVEVKDTAIPQKSDIAVLGPRNTFSDKAVKSYNDKASVYYASTITDVINLVATGRVKEGLVPLENSNTGSVRETQDGLFENNVYIEKTMPQTISLCLVANKKMPLKKVKKVISHPQPLLQSRQFLGQKLKQAEQMPVASTTQAIKELERRPDAPVAAVASKYAAKKAGLVILKEGIEDGDQNTTYFALIKKGAKAKISSKAKRTSIAFYFKKNKPGNLAVILNLFADNKINLTKIESRPSVTLKGDYVFYLDFDGSLESKKSKHVIVELKKLVANVKIFGSYAVN